MNGAQNRRVGRARARNQRADGARTDERNVDQRHQHPLHAIAVNRVQPGQQRRQLPLIRTRIDDMTSAPRRLDLRDHIRAAGSNDDDGVGDASGAQRFEDRADERTVASPQQRLRAAHA